MIAHLDIDAFFAAVEMHRRPELRGRPVVVGGDPHGRGVVATASYAARRFGIRSAMSAAEALRRCPDAVFVRPDIAHYREWSERVWDLVRELSPAVEVLGLDEGYLELPDEGAPAAADGVRRAVAERIRLSCSLGVATCKVVAKVASDRDKPGGVTVVPPGQEAAFLAPLPLRALPGVGPRTEERLGRAGLSTIGELAALGDDDLRGLVPGRFGEDLRRRARGVDPRPVAAVPPERISISAETTFERDLSERARLEAIGRELAESVAAALRRRGVAGRTVTVKMRYADFRTITRSQTVGAAVEDAEAIWTTAAPLLARALRERPGALRLLGVGVSGLSPERQLTLFQAQQLGSRAMSSATASGERLVRVVAAARAALEARAGEIDDLNVFPVADGDTGTNMLITAVAVEEAAGATAGLPWAERCSALARAALMGARGNSGMILSQIVRGAAESLAGEEERDVGGAALARALRRASDAADGAVRHPVVGTMLTVARRTAEAAEEAAGDGLAAVLDAALEGGRRGVAETPDLLDVLREAGVVDSGGMGLVVLLEGLGAGLLGREVAAPLDVARPRVVEAGHVPSRYRYCTSFLVEGAAIDLDALEASLLPLGDSLLVMGDAAQAKVHVHTDAPERAADAARAWGDVTGLRFDDMRRQEAERDARLRRAASAPEACTAIALVEGEGMRALVEGLGARALSPGAGSGEVAAALDAAGAAEAVLVVAGAEDLAAARAAAAGRDGVRVVDAGSLPALLAGLVGLDPSRPAGANAEEIAELAAGVRAAELDGTGAGALRPGLEAAVAGLAGSGPALVTVIIGASAGVSAPEVEGWVRAAAGADVEVEAHEGGQPRPALAVGVE